MVSVLEAIAKMIWNWRCYLVVGWISLAALMAYPAGLLVINALPLPKTPPGGTASALAEELFEADPTPFSHLFGPDFRRFRLDLHVFEVTFTAFH